jgi:hypothetical protein
MAWGSAAEEGAARKKETIKAGSSILAKGRDKPFALLNGVMLESCIATNLVSRIQ